MPPQAWRVWPPPWNSSDGRPLGGTVGVGGEREPVAGESERGAGGGVHHGSLPSASRAVTLSSSTAGGWRAVRSAPVDDETRWRAEQAAFTADHLARHAGGVRRRVKVMWWSASARRAAPT